MTATVKNFSIETKQETDFQYYDVGHGIAVYKLSLTSQVITSNDKVVIEPTPKVDITEGYCSLVSANKFSRHWPLSHEIKMDWHGPKKIKGTIHWMLATNELLEVLENSNCMSKQFDEAMVKYKQVTHQPFTMYQQAEDKTIFKLVGLNYYSGSTFYPDGSSPGQTLSFDYMENIDNANYDLPSVLVHISGNPLITFFEKEGAKITEIPSCNCDNDRYEQLKFKFKLSSDAYGQLTKDAKRGELSPSDLREMIIDQDVLGIAQFKISVD